MVATVTKPPARVGAMAHATPVRLVELVGPAGAGKTTLTRALCQQSRTIVMGEDIALRKSTHLPHFLRALPPCLPVVWEGRQQGKPFTWDEVKTMAYLTGWQALFQRQAASSEALVLLDHGPVFRLALLQALVPERAAQPAFARWSAARCQQWAAALEAVIWLDAPNHILEERINGRSQRHLVKGKAAAEAERFLESYRAAYASILTHLIGPRVLRFDTSQTTIEQVIQAVQGALLPTAAD